MSKNKVIAPNVVRGGIAIPIKGKTNYYYMSGRKHKNGGIDIGQNPRTGLEVEDGEVMHIANNEIKVFSSVPFLNGKSPAQKVLRGENPSTIFKQQEEFKDRNGINDDGSKKKENRNKAEWGMEENSAADVITDLIPIVGTAKEITRFVRKPSWSQAGNVGLSLAGDLIGFGIGKGISAISKANKIRKASKWTDAYFNAPKAAAKTHAARVAYANSKVAPKLVKTRGIANRKVIYKPAREIGEKEAQMYGQIATTVGVDVPINVIQNEISKKDKKLYSGPINPVNRAFITTLTNNEERQFQNWYKRVAKHKGLNPDPDAAGQDYDYRGYWKNEDRNGILGSNPNAHFKDKYKQPSHPTFSNQSKYSNVFTPGGEWVEGKGTWLFKHNKYTSRQAKRTHDYLMDTGEGYILGTDTIVPRSKKAMGGLSRSKDYGSKSKPYPNVKSKDFAGSNRSYPIPTKADAVDALRLAGLHGRSDVRDKVYAKYPELRKKAKAGGIYSVTVDGKTTLKRFPSTGSRTKAFFGKRKYIEQPNFIEEINTIIPQSLDIDYDKPFYNIIDKPEIKLPSESITNNTNTNIKRITTLPNINKNKQFIDGYSNPFYNFSPTDLKVSPLTKSAIKLPSENITYNYSRRQKIKNYIKEHPNTVSDSIGLTSNTIGGLISHSINRRMLDKLKYSPEPIAKSAAKLKTRININPQLDKMRESLADYENDISNNTASSNVALARKQRARFANVLQTNELYGNKENTETELINKDRINQQSIANENIRDYNNWLQNKTTFDNTIAEKKAENNIGLVETINSGIQNILTNKDKRYSEKQTRAAMLFANSNLPVEILYEQGLIDKATYKAYRKAHTIQNKNNIN